MMQIADKLREAVDCLKLCNCPGTTGTMHGVRTHHRSQQLFLECMEHILATFHAREWRAFARGDIQLGRDAPVVVGHLVLGGNLKAQNVFAIREPAVQTAHVAREHAVLFGGGISK